MTQDQPVWYYTTKETGANPIGPVTPKQLRDLVRQGNVKHDTLVYGTDEKWVPAHRYSFLANELNKHTVKSPPAIKDFQPSSTPVQTRSTDAPRIPLSRSPLRRTTPKSIVDLFDWRFEKYLTPWIVRLTWLATLAMFSLWALGLLVGYVTSSIETVSVDGDDSGTGSDAVTDYDFREPDESEVSFDSPLDSQWMKWQAIRTVALLSAIVGCFFCLLWVRVLLELAIVAFNIANTLTDIEGKLT